MILTVIGGGSSQWMKSLMRDVYPSPMKSWRIWKKCVRERGS